MFVPARTVVKRCIKVRPAYRQHTTHGQYRDRRETCAGRRVSTRTCKRYNCTLSNRKVHLRSGWCLRQSPQPENELWNGELPLVVHATTVPDSLSGLLLLLQA